MSYSNEEVQGAAEVLNQRLESLEDKKAILRSPELGALYERLKTLPAGEERAAFGREINLLKEELEEKVRSSQAPEIKRDPLDITAPVDVNARRPQLFSAEVGTVHPLMREMDEILGIFSRMGFSALESKELDDYYHMFTSLNFPPDHPARDEYDSFVTDEGLIAPAHTSTMQNRVLKERKTALENGEPIAVVIPGRVFRNEDLDARHEHTFYQLEGVYVDKGINAGNLAATIRTWLSSYFGREMPIKIQPFYFPFTEPSFEFAAGCPFCDQKGCNICSYTGWIELGGCGMIHPNVLSEGGIDSNTYTGFAWGFGIDRLVMLKYDIEDVRHFESANLKFLRQF
jgi:phenylalanyl-tRNA synthetase alpha chain